MPFRSTPSDRDARIFAALTRVAAWVVPALAVIAGVGHVRQRLRAASHAERRAATAPAGSVPAPDSSGVEESGTPPDPVRETYVPVWAVSLRHPAKIQVAPQLPLAPCESIADAGEPATADEDDDLEAETLVLSLTRAPFDSIAAREGFHRRDGRWVTVDKRGRVTDASDVRGPSWHGLTGGSGAQGRAVATIAHPEGCTVVLSYRPGPGGGGDSSVFRQMIESVRLGAAAAESELFPRDTAERAVTAPDSSGAQPASGETPGDTANRERALRDLGIGLVYLARDTAGSGPPGGSGQPENTILVYRERSMASRVVARYTGAPDGPLTLHTAGPVRPHTVEYGYEADGIPVLELAADSAWMRVQYGVDTVSATPRTGWVRRATRSLHFAPWVDLLASRDALFADSQTVLYDTPGGRRVDDESVAGGIGGSVMSPRLVRGPWMLVRVMTPSDYCDMPPGKARYSLVWVRALDERGRPLLGYPSRGC